MVKYCFMYMCVRVLYVTQLRVSELTERGPLVGKLQVWIAYFLEQNQCMIASHIGQNILIENVSDVTETFYRYSPFNYWHS